ncbi:hypothetical protein TRVL_06258 [Trypanosoma vivax]|nr:hypothetical protein TRVL_06258 [Trypanosoma vivax]
MSSSIVFDACVAEARVKNSTVLDERGKLCALRVNAFTVVRTPHTSPHTSSLCKLISRPPHLLHVLRHSTWHQKNRESTLIKRECARHAAYLSLIFPLSAQQLILSRRCTFEKCTQVHIRQCPTPRGKKQPTSKCISAYINKRRANRPSTLSCRVLAFLFFDAVSLAWHSHSILPLSFLFATGPRRSGKINASCNLLSETTS